MPRPIITLLTDFGTADHYAAAMKGVMMCICPDAHLLDISHLVTPFAIPEAAYTLAQSWRLFPKGTIHVVVVDPGVGSARRPILAEAGGHLFVAPDNGVLSMVLGAVPEYTVREITASEYFRQPVSQTFHGRDIFAPVAAHLAAGVPPEKFGASLDDAVRLDFGKPIQTADGSWTGMVLKIDWFGNIVTNFDEEQFGWVREQAFEVRVGSGVVRRYCRSYAEAQTKEPFVIAGSGSYLEISANEQNAAKILGVQAGAPVELKVVLSAIP
ncbi:MAG: SAM-dependent chlorinase/fluorinase [Bryobacteraceae bacterium]|jgi:S-adenosylmethionine hydrolase